MPKASPLGSLDYEVVHQAMSESSAENDNEMLSQAPLHTSHSGTDTFKVSQKENTERSELELRKMNINGGKNISESRHGD